MLHPKDKGREKGRWGLTPGREVRGMGALRTRKGPLAGSRALSPEPWGGGGWGAGVGWGGCRPVPLRMDPLPTAQETAEGPPSRSRQCFSSEFLAPIFWAVDSTPCIGLTKQSGHFYC